MNSKGESQQAVTPGQSADVEAAQVREEIKACIEFYERSGSDWVSAVTFIGFQHLFGDARIIHRDSFSRVPRAGRPRHASTSKDPGPGAPPPTSTESF